jgi:hypothetical protein
MMSGSVAKFPSYSAAAARNSAAGRLVQSVSKPLIYANFWLEKAAFGRAERVFPLSAGEMAMLSVMAKGPALPLEAA